MPPRTKRQAESHISDPIAALATEAPDRPIVQTGSRSFDDEPDVREWTAAEFDRWIHQIERRLVSRGIGPGTPIAVLSPRCPSTIALLWAIWRVGGIAVPLNTRQPPSTAVDQASRARAELLISTNQTALQSAMQSGIRAAPFDALTSPPTSEKSSPASGPVGGPAGGASVAFPSEGSLRASLLPLDARATGLFTSGSTGTPKIAVHTLGNHVFSARGSAENISLTAGDRWLASLPLYHVGGLAILFRCALAGATVAVPAEAMSVAEAIQMLRPTHLSLVATQLKRVLKATERGTVRAAAWSAMKAVLLGGSAIPSRLLDSAYEKGWPVYTSYGSTEMTSQVAATPPNASREMLHSSGRCLPHRTLSIRPPDGCGAEDGAPGEIYVGGDTLFAGYATDDGVGGSLEPTRTATGEFRTGDLGWIDANGCLHVSGRADRLIISGGENIQPEEVEAAIEQCDGVLRAAVVGVPDDEFGQRPVAFVEWEGEPRDLDSDLRDRLPGYKLPKAVYPMPEEAMQDHLKVDYARLELTARKLQK